jgi:rhodanese-related sulfurtransferase
LSFERITPEEAFRRADEEGYHLLDVRSVSEFEAGHPAGSFNIPLMHLDPATGMMRPNIEFLAHVMRHFSPDDKIVVCCKSGGRSARAVSLMQEKGFRYLVDQRAGWDGERAPSGKLLMAGWGASNLPCGEGDAGERSYAALAS